MRIRLWLKRWRLPLLVFAAIWIHGATIGLTDDEAYYWVLAQKPALGYAFHPPAVALCIATVQALLGWLAGHHCVALVRMPAAACAAGFLALGMRWIERAGAGALEDARERGGLVIIAFAGMFALAWMIVPDLPLFLGWTLAFGATWELCFSAEPRISQTWVQAVALGAGVWLAAFSKYSGVLAGASSLIAIWLWAPRERRSKAITALFFGGLLAAAPILWWNSQHEWASILYQIRERHGDGRISFVRYLRFWLIELVLMGPALFVYSLGMFLRAIWGRISSNERFVLVWAMPGALVFCLQPLWADFKPHWALIVWWPLALGLALAWAQGERKTLGKLHVRYGLGLIAIVWLSCHVSLGSWLSDPRIDVTNDLYAWSDLRQFVLDTLGPEALHTPFVGSRYQTAAQAAFSLGEGTQATLLPRDLKAMDEWPDLGVSASQGPDWPKLLKPVFYVADNRYDSGPEYPDSRCEKALPLQAQRMGHPAKTIYLWKCVPRSWRP